MFANEIANLPSSERPHYYRFNVDQGLEDIGLEEWRESQKLTEATEAYLRGHRGDIESCTLQGQSIQDVFMVSSARFLGLARIEA
jgi:hypothetical protein